MIADFHRGTAAWRLAERYGLCLSTVKTVLRLQEARLLDVQQVGRVAASSAREPQAPKQKQGSRLVIQIQQARARGQLPEAFGPNEIRAACPGWAEATYRNVLPNYRLGNPNGRTPYFERLADGRYSLL